jgi:hypothetical protein
MTIDEFITIRAFPVYQTLKSLLCRRKAMQGDIFMMIEIGDHNLNSS